MDIHLSDGSIKTRCWLVVRNITGINEERGFRLFWDDGGDYLTPALGYATSNPFPTMRAAVGYGERQGWGKAKKI